jgi:pimeloyl-ACP methyl ester carboxylesterase
LRDRLEKQLKLERRQCGAEASVRPAAERDVRVTVGTARTYLVRSYCRGFVTMSSRGGRGQTRETFDRWGTDAMAEYVRLDGLRTWYEEHGDGSPLVLLHPGGAGVGSRAWRPNVGALTAHFRVYMPDRRGHGHTPDVEGPITFEAMAQDTIAFLDTVIGGAAHIVGCSDGAIVALLVALHRPDLIGRLVLVAGVFHHDGWAPGVIDPDAEPPEFLERLYGEVSPDGPDHYRVIVDKLARTHTHRSQRWP